ncbi:hypothetical protein [Allorhizobium taibaishanense]|uniref:Uncharacterized protein n=1 Tax=Allorhizobium taibaishanense TaxID=887144 RepID=A0A7W6HR20_9HYPH|nr:hypothetical protein [Allorhizobium taibaishanense]MBB4009421.1 hypothetical protein [Allorhizobium taibaishanense]
MEDPFGWFGAFYPKNSADGIIQIVLLIEMIIGPSPGDGRAPDQKREVDEE